MSVQPLHVPAMTLLKNVLLQVSGRSRQTGALLKLSTRIRESKPIFQPLIVLKKKTEDKGASILVKEIEQQANEILGPYEKKGI